MEKLPRLSGAVLRFVRLGLAILGCLLALTVSELALRQFWAFGSSYYLQIPHRTEILTPEHGLLPGIDGPARFQINSIGLRGPEVGPDRAREYRIVALGGSTTESLFLDQDSTWPALLQQQLAGTRDGRTVWVGNAGKSGLSSRHHLGFVRLALHQYRPDTLIVLVGVNDLLVRVGEGTAYDPEFVDRPFFSTWATYQFVSAPWYVENDGSMVSGIGLARPLALRRAGQQGRRLFQKLASGEVVDRTGQFYAERRRLRQAATLVETLPPMDAALDEYERNLARLVTEARVQGVRVILLTQPTLWAAELTPAQRALLAFGKSPDPQQYYSERALAEGMAAYNRRLLTVCSLLSVECLDLATLIPRTFDIFYDEMHFNVGGTRAVASQVSRYLARTPPFTSTADKPLESP